MVKQLLAAADVFVLPSIYEPQGLAVLEAMAMRKPVVASCVGGIPEMVEQGMNGLLIPPGSQKKLAKGIIRLLGDEALRNCLGRNGRFLVETRFNCNYTSEFMMRLYEAVLSEQTTNINLQGKW